jgi:hypothetical protein
MSDEVKTSPPRRPMGTLGKESLFWRKCLPVAIWEDEIGYMERIKCQTK